MVTAIVPPKARSASSLIVKTLVTIKMPARMNTTKRVILEMRLSSRRRRAWPSPSRSRVLVTTRDTARATTMMKPARISFSGLRKSAKALKSVSTFRPRSRVSWTTVGGA